MVKLYGLLPKRADLTEEEFHAHWGVLHAPLGARISAMRHYAQSHRLPIVAAGTRPVAFDGAAECWFESVETADIGDDPEYTEIAGKDDPTFLDTDELAFLTVDEQVVLPEDGAPRDWTRAHFAAGTKVLFFIKRRPDVGVEDFRAFMGEHADRLTRAKPAMVRYVHGWVHPGPDGAEPTFDCVDEMCWTGTAVFESAWRSRAIQDALEEAARVLDLDASLTLVARERRVY